MRQRENEKLLEKEIKRSLESLSLIHILLCSRIREPAAGF